MAFCNSLGYEWGTDNRFKVFHDGRYAIEEGNRNECYQYCTNRPYLVSGKSPRGVYHVCIYLNGKLAWDPHPSREGLVTEEYFETIVKTTP